MTCMIFQPALPCPPLPAAGGLINTAHLAARQPPDSQPAAYILTASHCRSYDTADDAASYYSVVLDYERQGCRGGSRRRKQRRRALGSGAARPDNGVSGTGSVLTAPTLRELQGVHVAWQDEATDVLLLRLDGAIPTGAEWSTPLLAVWPSCPPSHLPLSLLFASTRLAGRHPLGDQAPTWLQILAPTIWDGMPAGRPQTQARLSRSGGCCCAAPAVPMLMWVLRQQSACRGLIAAWAPLLAATLEEISRRLRTALAACGVPATLQAGAMAQHTTR